VGAIAADFGFARWEGPDALWRQGAFLMFGLGSLPAGRLGDLWGRRRMMLVFFFGIGRVGAAGRAGAERLAAGRRADAAGRCFGHLPPGGHPDAAAARTGPGRTIGSTGWRATWALRWPRC
jgi:MFS family permease